MFIVGFRLRRERRKARGDCLRFNKVRGYQCRRRRYQRRLFGENKHRHRQRQCRLRLVVGDVNARLAVNNRQRQICGRVVQAESARAQTARRAKRGKREAVGDSRRRRHRALRLQLQSCRHYRRYRLFHCRRLRVFVVGVNRDCQSARRRCDKQTIVARADDGVGQGIAYYCDILRAVDARQCPADSGGACGEVIPAKAAARRHRQQCDRRAGNRRGIRRRRMQGKLRRLHGDEDNTRRGGKFVALFAFGCVSVGRGYQRRHRQCAARRRCQTYHQQTALRNRRGKMMFVRLREDCVKRKRLQTAGDARRRQCPDDAFIFNRQCHNRRMRAQ